MQKRWVTEIVERLEPCVVDIGARNGVDEDFLSIGWATKVIGFEPEPEEAIRLSQRHDSRWKEVVVLPFAVGGTCGAATLHIPATSEGASLLRHNPSMVGLFGYENLHIVEHEVPVKTVTLDYLKETGSLPRVDYLKIDIEGAELDVLRSAKNVLRDCVSIKVECSFLEQRLNQPLIWEVAQFLLGEGFAIVGTRAVRRWRRRNLPSHPYWIDFEMPYSEGQLAQCDLIVLRDIDSIQSEDQALRLIIASAVLGYFDHAVNVLRKVPQLREMVKGEFGLDLEAELGLWAGERGRREVKQAIRASLRGLVPLFRSFLGRLPYPTPTKPY